MRGHPHARRVLRPGGPGLKQWIRWHGELPNRLTPWASIPKISLEILVGEWMELPKPNKIIFSRASANQIWLQKLFLVGIDRLNLYQPVAYARKDRTNQDRFCRRMVYTVRTSNEAVFLRSYWQRAPTRQPAGFNEHRWCQD